MKSDEPTDEIERTLAAMWANVLKRPSVGLDDNFFELGGSSLDAMRLFAQIERRTGRSLRYYTRHNQRIPPDLREDRLIQHFGTVTQQYRPRPSHGPVTLFRAKDIHRVFTHMGPSLGWDAATLPNLTVVEIPGDHSCVFREPHIETLATQVSALLRDTDTGN